MDECKPLPPRGTIARRCTGSGGRPNSRAWQVLLAASYDAVDLKKREGYRMCDHDVAGNIRQALEGRAGFSRHVMGWMPFASRNARDQDVCP